MIRIDRKMAVAPARRALAAMVLVVFGGVAHAGSYEDFFTRIIRDDAPGIAALVKRGFDPNTLSEKGETGLTQAFKLDSYRAAKGLAALPSTNVNLPNSKGETPLMLAAIKGQVDIAKVLIARGADVNREGWTPLHYAVSAPSDEGADLKMVALLIENHAYIDAASPNGTTPLMMAAQYGTRSAVQMLIKEGADPAVKNQQGLTAKDFAARADRSEVVRWLAQAGGAAGAVAAGTAAGRAGAKAEGKAGAAAGNPNGTTVPPAFPQSGRRKIQSNW